MGGMDEEDDVDMASQQAIPLYSLQIPNETFQHYT
jgi:hypothetical protein